MENYGIFLIMGNAGFISSTVCLGVNWLLSNQGEKSIDFYFIRVLLTKKVLKYGTPKPR